jgi:hypothetical protein
LTPLVVGVLILEKKLANQSHQREKVIIVWTEDEVDLLISVILEYKAARMIGKPGSQSILTFWICS